MARVASVLSAAFLLAGAAAQTIEPLSWSSAQTLAAGLTANLTLSEKIGIVTGGGILTRCVGNTSPVNRTLPNAPAGFPALCLEDGPAGVRDVDLVTGWAAGINAASTFSRSLMNARGQAMAEEFRGKGIHVWLGPAVDLMRNPKAGRAWEGFGADPYLAGEAAYETVTGAQSVGVQVCVKHFIAYVQEHYRTTYSAAVSDRTLHELYFVPYQRAIEANVSAVMCSYNEVNGTYACMNGPGFAMLRDAGFQGYTMSDWGATHPSTQATVDAGLDMEMPGGFILIGGGVYGDVLETDVGLGLVNESAVDAMVQRIVAPWFMLRQDQGYPATNFDVNGDENENVNVRSDAHTALERQIAAASHVLLKNVNGALPLTGTERTVAVIGLDAVYPEQDCSENECDNGSVTVGWGSGTNNISFVVAPATAIQDYATTNLSSATNVTLSGTNDVAPGVAAAEGADVAIVFINAYSGEGVATVDGNFGDRNDMNAWLDTDSLVEAVAAVNPNTIVVIHSVGPILMPWANSTNISAIIYAGLPGEQTGPALVDILYGAVNPSGRLPFTIAHADTDYPTTIDYIDINPSPTLNFSETLFIDYRHFDAASIAPLFEFGFGLSYTNFSYDALSASAESVSFTLTNSGGVSGTEIPQLYIGFPEGAGEPPKVLRGFEDVALAAGQSATVTFALTERDISIWDTVSQAWVVPEGTFNVYVGASSRDIRLTGSF